MSSKEAVIDKGIELALKAAKEADKQTNQNKYGPLKIVNDGETVLKQMTESQKPDDRPDIVSRVFKIKLEQLMDNFCENHYFGKVKAEYFDVRGRNEQCIRVWRRKEQHVDD
ncbi:hypothetical protein FRX31_028663 [Thalictrum thalictroides]|uniref:Helitron helicase-like domain-containing protein n=1 Tax=Thalictrum thalictroides TaxID=46969 RepID=A0A7J6VBZ6_THATH|nr:hypothetical protein FRX31_028663 [Thalictrum thalictroides]